MDRYDTNSMKEINKNLSKVLESNRVIVWYDEEQEYADQLSNLELTDISILILWIYLIFHELFESGNDCIDLYD